MNFEEQVLNKLDHPSIKLLLQNFQGIYIYMYFHSHNLPTEQSKIMSHRNDWQKWNMQMIQAFSLLFAMNNTRIKFEMKICPNKKSVMPQSRVYYSYAI